MAFTVTNDHARQEQVWKGLSRSHNREPYFVRRQLTGAVRASDRRAQFVGIDGYEAAGGVIMRASSSMTMAAGSRTRRCSIAS
jgi:ParB family transcriptional regulator, chromosome partitioning protein